jgi:hypothetical protein
MRNIHRRYRVRTVDLCCSGISCEKGGGEDQLSATRTKAERRGARGYKAYLFDIVKDERPRSWWPIVTTVL